MYKGLKILPTGDCAILVEFGDEISKKINNEVIKFVNVINKENIEGVLELVPTYRSVIIYYNPLLIDNKKLISKIRSLDSKNIHQEDENVRVVEIPTLYGGTFGEDIGFVASHNNLTEKEVIDIHSGTDYLVYMLGFTPGFTYLGGLNEKISAPRLDSPREKIPAGSVGIAGTQTGIYPSETPGGWQLIGRTPLQLFNPDRTPPVFINAGDYIRYIPITEKEYEEIKKKVSEGRYNVREFILERGDLNE